MSDREPNHPGILEGQAFDLLHRGDPALQTYAGQLPEPWQLALMTNTPLGEALEQIWEPILIRARGFVTRLTILTTDLALAVSPSGAFTPYLFYIQEAGGKRGGWLAGYPAGDHDYENTERRLGTPLPGSYRRFTGVHDGFLEDGNTGIGFAALHQLDWFGEAPPGGGQIEAPDDPGTNPGKALVFWGNGRGSYQYYDLTKPATHQDFQTRSWEPAAHQASKTRSFWSFLKEFTILHF